MSGVINAIPLTGRLSQRLKDAFLGTHRFNTQYIIDEFESTIDETMDFEPVPNKTPFSLNYKVGHAYYVKVITQKNRRLHKLSTRWRNTTYRVTQTGAPFQAFSSVEEMAEHQFTAARELHENGGATPYPYDYRELATGDMAILYDYVANIGPSADGDKTLKEFEHVTKTLKRLHENKHTHGYINGHVIRTTPDGEPYLTDPIGRTRDTHAAELLGIGHDLATLLISYSPVVGTIPAIEILREHYTDVEIVAAYAATKPIQSTKLGLSQWIVTHVKSSINKVTEPDAIETYLEIMSKSKEKQYFDEDYETADSTRDILTNLTSTSNSDDTNEANEKTTDIDTRGRGTQQSDNETKLGRFSK